MSGSSGAITDGHRREAVARDHLESENRCDLTATTLRRLGGVP